jgi:hypothetical protein
MLGMEQLSPLHKQRPEKYRKGKERAGDNAGCLLPQVVKLLTATEENIFTPNLS